MAIALMANSNRISGMGRTVTEARQCFTFTRCAMVLGAIQSGIGMLLAGRMAWISIAENEHYEPFSESNRVNLPLVPPTRGWIVERYYRMSALWGVSEPVRDGPAVCRTFKHKYYNH